MGGALDHCAPPFRWQRSEVASPEGTKHQGTAWRWASHSEAHVR